MTLPDLSAEIWKQSSSLEVCVTIAANDGGWNCAALRREQLHDSNMRLRLRELEGGEHPKCEDTTDHSPIEEGYWAQRNFLVARDGILEHH